MRGDKGLKFRQFADMRVLLLLFLLAAPVMAQDGEAGHRLWHFWRNECATCHGQDGKGIDAIQVPAIAGLPDYYVLQQIHKFRDGLRGQDPDESSVYFMHREAVELDDGLYRELAGIIAGMEPRRTLHSVIGDVDRGERLYLRNCAGCHGSAAEGNPSKESPPLYLFQDWCLVDQIERFQRGKRRADPLNVESVKMHAMTKRLWRQRHVYDLAAYVTTRAQGEPDADP